MEVISTSFLSQNSQTFPAATMIQLGRAAHERSGPNFSSFYHLPKFSNKTAICHYYHVFPIILCILTKEKVLTYALVCAILVSESKGTNGGQRQRIGIARALATKPEFIVCDGPIAALDSSIQAQVINLMMDLQQELGLTYLFISHDLSMVRHISDRICIMYLGAVAELGEADEIDKSPIHPYTEALFYAVPQIDDQNWSSKRIKLEGEIPNPINAPKGCRFCTRCPLAKDICKEQQPDMIEVEPGHFVKCTLAEK